MNDIALNSDFSPRIASGDFVIADDQAQRVALLLKANTGEFRQWPTLGIGLQQHINGSNLADLKNKFNSQVHQIEGIPAEIQIGADGSVAIVV